MYRFEEVAFTSRIVYPAVENPQESTTKTAVVVGMSRGGTSLVAAVLDACGIPMYGANESTFENQSLMWTTDPSHYAPEIARLDRLAPVWGFKNPHGTEVVDSIVPLLRSPYCLFIARDPVAIAERLHTNGKQRTLHPIEIAAGLLEEYRKLLDRYMECKHPKIFFTFDRAIRFPQIVVEGCCHLLALRPTPAQWGKAMSSVSPQGGYLSRQ